MSFQSVLSILLPNIGFVKMMQQRQIPTRQQEEEEEEVEAEEEEVQEVSENEAPQAQQPMHTQEEETHNTQHASQRHAVSQKITPEELARTRRKLRQKYRNLMNSTSAAKQSLVDPQSDGLLDALHEVNRLFLKVQTPREAALDAELVGQVSTLAVEQAAKLSTGFRTWSPASFFTKLLAKFKPYTDPFDWTALGATVAPVLASTPTISFMSGPVKLQEPEKKKARRAAQREAEAPKTRPDEVTTTVEAEDKETAHRVQVMHTQLKNNGVLPFHKVYINPDSFSQSVENLFYLSFLVKEGMVEVKETGADNFSVGVKEAADREGCQSKQSVVSLNYDTWQRLSKEVHQSLMPTREVGSYLSAPNQPMAQASNEDQEEVREMPRKRRR